MGRASEDPAGDDQDDSHRDESLFTLVSMIEKIKQRRRTANDHYVERYLSTSLGLQADDVDAFLATHNRHYNTPLSVKQDLEPVVMFMRSTGVSGEQVATLATKAPLIFRKRADELFLMFEWASKRLGSEDKARLLLLRRPEAFVVDGLDAFREAL